MKRKTTEEFILELGDDFQLIGEYINNKTKVCIKSNKTNKIYYIRPVDFIYYGLSEKKSKGENRIEEYLTQKEIRFIPQYKIKECKNIRPLPFDFAILNNKGKVEFLIEYQGEQHYKSGCFGQSQEDFIDQQKRDNIKSNYCKENNIPLLLNTIH